MALMSKRRRRQWGNGSVRRRGGSWQLRWVEGGRRRARSGFRTRDEAERVLAKIMGDIAQGRTGLPPDPRGVPTLAVLAEPFLTARDATHRAADMDRIRWRKHLAPHFGHLRPSEVDPAMIRTFARAKLREGLAAGTVRVLVSLLSALFVELIEDHQAQTNPARSLPRSTRQLIKPTHDPRTTPFIEALADVRRIFLDLPPPLSTAYAIGAMAGLRTGEVFALKWEHVDLAARRIHVRESVRGPLKDKDSRVVPILDSLFPVLAAWKMRTGGRGLVIPPMRRDGDKIDKHTPGRYLAATLERLGLSRPGLGWYEATRHTFASQWVLAGGSIEKLSKILGHASIVQTEVYVHLRPDLFAARDFGTIHLDLVTEPSEPGRLGTDKGQTPETGLQVAASTSETPEPPCKPGTDSGDRS